MDVQENVLHIFGNILAGVFFDDEQQKVIVVDGLLFFNILLVLDDIGQDRLSLEFKCLEVASEFAGRGDISLGDLLNLLKGFDGKDHEVEKSSNVLALILLVLLQL